MNKKTIQSYMAIAIALALIAILFELMELSIKSGIAYGVFLFQLGAILVLCVMALLSVYVVWNIKSKN